MNLLILHGSSDFYGASKILYISINIFKSQGHNITVVLSERGLLSDNLEKIGVEVKIIKLGILRRKYKSISGIVNRIFTIVRAYFVISKLAREKNIEVIYSNTTAVVVGAFVAKFNRIRHIWHIHEIILYPTIFFRSIGFIVNNFSDTVIVVSEAVKRHWSTVISKNKFSLIHNAINYNENYDSNYSVRKELNLGENEVLIAMIGRVHFWKGQEYFIQIASHLSKSYSNIKFIMVGDAFPGYEYLFQKISKQKKDLQIEDQIYDLGYRTDVISILNSIDIFVLPSILPDPFPTVILEAMSCSKPVVATNHGGAKQMVIHNQTGLLIPCDNSEISAKMIGKLIESKNLRYEFGRAGREFVTTKFSMQNFENNINRTILNVK